MDGIEPVTSPAFAIAGGGEELIYEISSCSCAFVFNEGSDFFGSRKAAVEIDEEASSKSGEVGWGSKVEIVLSKFLLNEGVDGVSRGRGAGAVSFLRDHQLVSIAFAWESVRGSGAPRLTQSTRMLIFSSGSFFFGGIS